jgi:hypothetical protein
VIRERKTVFGLPKKYMGEIAEHDISRDVNAP